jgi:hypothetical protein
MKLKSPLLAAYALLAATTLLGADPEKPEKLPWAQPDRFVFGNLYEGAMVEGTLGVYSDDWVKGILLLCTNPASPKYFLARLFQGRRISFPHRIPRDKHVRRPTSRRSHASYFP